MILTPCPYDPINVGQMVAYRTTEQRQQIRKFYTTMYGRDLLPGIDAITSGKLQRVIMVRVFFQRVITGKEVPPFDCMHTRILSRVSCMRYAHTTGYNWIQLDTTGEVHARVGVGSVGIVSPM